MLPPARSTTQVSPISLSSSRAKLSCSLPLFLTLTVWLFCFRRPRAAHLRASGGVLWERSGGFLRAAEAHAGPAAVLGVFLLQSAGHGRSARSWSSSQLDQRRRAEQDAAHNGRSRGEQPEPLSLTHQT